MADAYYDYNDGLTANDGLTPTTAKSTRTEAQVVAGTGDKVIAVDGTQTLPASEGGDIFFDFDDDFVESAATFRGATLEPEAAETTRVARVSGSGTPRTVENLKFNGQANGGLTQAFDILRVDGTPLKITHINGCEFVSGNSYGMYIGQRVGSQFLDNCKFTGSPSVGMVSTGGSALSGVAAQTVEVNNSQFVGSITSGSITGIGLDKANTTTYALTLTVQGCYGTFTVTGSGNAVGANIKAVDPLISNCSFDIDASNTTGTGHFGILVQGQSVAVATNPRISGCTVNFNAKAGYGIALGQSTADANVTGGEASGNRVTGAYYVSNTPHGFVMGQGLSGAIMRGNVCDNIYATYLLSLTDSGTFEGNLAFDPYGPAFYIKGATDITVQDNVAVYSSKYDCTDSVDSGISCIAVNSQGTATLAATIRRNVVIVADIDKVQSLACILSGQTCTFSNNTYIIPTHRSDGSVIDIKATDGTADFFAFGNASLASNAANNTLEEWNAQTEVTNDKIVQLPQEEISELIAIYDPSGEGATISADGESFWRSREE